MCTVYNSIELNIQRMTIYKNISLDNIPTKKNMKRTVKSMTIFHWKCRLLLVTCTKSLGVEMFIT